LCKKPFSAFIFIIREIYEQTIYLHICIYRYVTSNEGERERVRGILTNTVASRLPRETPRYTCENSFTHNFARLGVHLFNFFFYRARILHAFLAPRPYRAQHRLLFRPLARKLQFPRSFVVKYSLHIRVIMSEPVSLLTKLTTPVIRFPLPVSPVWNARFTFIL
jgi:hypothetical protein